MSEEYLEAAETMLAAGHLAPGYHAALHSLELAAKAALATRMEPVPRTHNVGGLFAREFRDVVGSESCSRINALVKGYDAPRHPDWEPPEEIDEDVAFIAHFVRSVLPGLIGGSS